MIRILCTGSRKFLSVETIRSALNAVKERWHPQPITVVHGDCQKGADAIVDKVARELGVRVERHPAEWGALGNAAGQIRNTKMVKLGAHECLAFWDGNSKGTRDCLSKAVRGRIPTQIIPAPKSTDAEERK